MITPKLIEINKAKESLINITRTFSEEFRKKQNEAFNSEIDTVIGKFGFQKLIDLNWKVSGINIDTVCMVKANIALNASTQEALIHESSPTPHLYQPIIISKPRKRSKNVKKVHPYTVPKPPVTSTPEVAANSVDSHPCSSPNSTDWWVIKGLPDDSSY